MKYLLPFALIAVLGGACNRAHEMEREEDTQSIQREEEIDSSDFVDETPSNVEANPNSFDTTEEQAVGTEP